MTVHQRMYSSQERLPIVSPELQRSSALIYPPRGVWIKISFGKWRPFLHGEQKTGLFVFGGRKHRVQNKS